MLTLKEGRIWRSTLRWTTTTAIFPFVWKNGQLIRRSSFWRIPNRLILFYYLTSMIYVIYNEIRVNQSQSRIRAMVNACTIVYYVSVCTVRLAYELYADEAMELVNQTLRLNSCFGIFTKTFSLLRSCICD